MQQLLNCVEISRSTSGFSPLKGFALILGCIPKLNEVLATYFTGPSICGLKCDALLREVLQLAEGSDGCQEFVRDVSLRLETLGDIRDNQQ